jgi:DNA-binding MurR/RpiR family transcriptional regulator
VRFAKAVGFESASQMQKVIRDGLIAGNAVLGYGERVRQFSEGVDSREAGSPGALLAEFIEGNVLALNNLRGLLDESDLEAGVELIAAADTIYVVGFRRSLPVSSYLAYSLQQLRKRTVFVDGVGGLARQQVQAIGEGDLLIAVSYHPYADETVKAVETAVANGADVLTITDSLVGPVAKPASVVLQVREAEVRKFRSLAASLCVAQALVISYAFEVTQAERAAKTGSAAKGRRRA